MPSLADAGINASLHAFVYVYVSIPGRCTHGVSAALSHTVWDRNTPSVWMRGRQTGPCLMRFGGHDDLSLEGMTSGAKHPPSCCLPVCSELRHLTAKPVHARRVLKTPLPCTDNDSVDIAYASAHRHTLNAQLQMHMTDRAYMVCHEHQRH